MNIKEELDKLPYITICFKKVNGLVKLATREFNLKNYTLKDIEANLPEGCTGIELLENGKYRLFRLVRMNINNKENAKI